MADTEYRVRIKIKDCELEISAPYSQYVTKMVKELLGQIKAETIKYALVEADEIQK